MATKKSKPKQLELLDKNINQIGAARKVTTTFAKERKTKEKTYHAKTHNVYHVVKGISMAKLRKGRKEFAAIQKALNLNPVAQRRNEIKNLLQNSFDVEDITIQKSTTKAVTENKTQVQRKTNRGYKQFIKAMPTQTPTITPTPPTPHPMVGKPESHQDLLNRARTGDSSVMHHEKAHVIRDAQGMTPLHHLAMRGNTNILQHEHVHEPTDKLNRTPLHYLAQQNKTDVIHHPQVSTQRDTLGKTPLHYLAAAGNKAVLGHEDVAKVKDFSGKTPLHSLAYHKDSAVTSHPDFDTVKDDKGRTPKDIYNSIQKALAITRALVGEVYNDALTKGGFGSGKKYGTGSYNKLLSQQRHLEGLKPALRERATGKIHPAEWDEHAHEDIKDRLFGDKYAGHDTHEEGFTTHGKDFIDRNEADKKYGIMTSAELGYKKSFIANQLKSMKKSDPVKKRYTVNGIRICVEWPKGTVRTYRKDGKVCDGLKQAADYGYIEGTTSPDGEEIDVYVGPNKISDKVYLLLQKPIKGEKVRDTKTGELVATTQPEEKFMLGFKHASESVKAYKNSMPSKWFDSVLEIKWSDLEDKVRRNVKSSGEHGGMPETKLSNTRAHKELKRAVSATGNGGMPGYNHFNTQEKRNRSKKKNGHQIPGAVTKGDLSTMPQMSAGQSRQNQGQSYTDQADIVKARKMMKSGPFGTPPFDEPTEAARTYWEDARWNRQPFRERDGKRNPKVEKLFRKLGDVQKAIVKLAKNNPSLVIKL